MENVVPQWNEIQKLVGSCLQFIALLRLRHVSDQIAELLRNLPSRKFVLHESLQGTGFDSLRAIHGIPLADREAKCRDPKRAGEWIFDRLSEP